MNAQIDLVRMDKESLSPEAYLNLSESEKRDIAETKIIPAKLGAADFGQIQVTYKTSVYKYKNEQ